MLFTFFSTLFRNIVNDILVLHDNIVIFAFYAYFKIFINVRFWTYLFTQNIIFQNAMLKMP